MKILLTGYMGSGKSTIGAHLAEILNYEFVDLDQYIEAYESQSVSELFKTKGEIYFRKKETSYLHEVLSKNESSVIALGGGTPCYGNNMKLILDAAEAKSIYLKLSIPSLVKRLELEKSKRPLISHLKSSEELTEFVGKHLFERSFYYSQANFTIKADEKTIEEIVETIIMELF
jgi:shikimate kinase|uniref:shikimate kinase n=1 Tax=Gelidibacter sp. TaxID=2018083 RepID=UPI00404A1815